jgi:hypothetical protein
MINLLFLLQIITLNASKCAIWVTISMVAAFWGVRSTESLRPGFIGALEARLGLHPSRTLPRGCTCL